MQIVINICKDDFEEICMQARMVEDTGSLFGRIRKAVSHSVPLPKGHGTLKDTDAICEDIISALGIRDENYLLEAEKAVYKRIKNAPTIIEADGVESEETDERG